MSKKFSLLTNITWRRSILRLRHKREEDRAKDDCWRYQQNGNFGFEFKSKLKLDSLALQYWSHIEGPESVPSVIPTLLQDTTFTISDQNDPTKRRTVPFGRETGQLRRKSWSVLMADGGNHQGKDIHWHFPHLKGSNSVVALWAITLS